MKSKNLLNQSELTLGSMRDQNSGHALLHHDSYVGARAASFFRIVEPTVVSEILMITTFPPRECGIATYSQDLIEAVGRTFEPTFLVKVCALENTQEHHEYPGIVEHRLNVDLPADYLRMAEVINQREAVKMVVVQHEFGLFSGQEVYFLQFLEALQKPSLVVFHTVLPNPDPLLSVLVQRIALHASGLMVMTQASSDILQKEYGISPEKVHLIPHGTHLAVPVDRNSLKDKHNLAGRDVLATFGLMSAGKGIELSLDALPAIIREHPAVILLIIGKTHPTVVKNEGERYREFLKEKVKTLDLEDHVRYLDYFLPLPELLEYLQLTDIYLFTSNDPHQAVSGTFSYAISSGCPVISTPIPHAQEVLGNDAGILIEFGNAAQLSDAVNRLLSDEEARNNLASHGLHRMASTAWENTALAHLSLFNEITGGELSLEYRVPALKQNHLIQLTTDIGVIQFSKLNQPDLSSGYTLDDNARALIVVCQLFKLNRMAGDMERIDKYLGFIERCQRADGRFLNYIDESGQFTSQNRTTNLDDANGRAIWALGYLLSLGDLLPAVTHERAENILDTALTKAMKLHSTRAIAFVIKGLSARYSMGRKAEDLNKIVTMANRLLQMYRHVADDSWKWFENYLTYANGVIPEAMLNAYVATGDSQYKDVAKASFDFLLEKTMKDGMLTVVCNRHWLQRGDDSGANTSDFVHGGEQPIDVAYTILALKAFHEVFDQVGYQEKMLTAFAWFLGNNHLHRVIYNPATGGCYDGLEADHVNLNQGAESTVSYMMARLSLPASAGPITDEPKAARHQMLISNASS